MASARELSILIPARNEIWLQKTLDDIFAHSEADTEVNVVLDGVNQNLTSHPKLNIIYLPQSIGQRAATNLAAKMSQAQYLMKVDAHCAFRQGFDKSMLKAFKEIGEDNLTMVPTMRNLHIFNWVCPQGHIRYQGPSGPCQETNCGQPTERDIVWLAKPRPESRSYCFDSEPHFQYFNEYLKRFPKNHSNLTETMSLQGSCFMLSRENYWKLNICDESLGSWGSQGIEVACKTWLSGGRVVVNHRTWYAHLFRTQGKDFSFPYPQKEYLIQEAKQKVKNLFWEAQWPQQILPLSWLVEKFWPVKGWNDEDLQRLKELETFNHYSKL